MILQEFTPFFFEPISFTLFYEKLNPEYHFNTTAIAKETYNAWLDEYLRRAKKFYCAQYVRHYNYVLRNFRLKYNLPEDSAPDDWDLEDEWSAIYSDCGLQDHYEKCKSINNQIDLARRGFQVRDGNLLHVLGKFNCALRRPIPATPINELWFNTTINNALAMINELRRLEYRMYLQSYHWARVRAATLLIHDAICQSDECYSIGESWYYGDWESDIHVHHLNYENIGNERYQDLVLLCSRHHARWHENMKNTGRPGVELYDDWLF